MTRTCMPVLCICCVSCRQQPLTTNCSFLQRYLRGCLCSIVCELEVSTTRQSTHQSGCCTTAKKEIMFTDEKVKIMKLIRNYFCFRSSVTSFAFGSHIRFTILFPNIVNLYSFLKYREELPYQHKPTCKINTARLKNYITVYQAGKKLNCKNTLPKGGF